MSEFRLIDGQLFYTVKPEPLTLDSQFPCLVRHKSARHQDLICTGISDSGGALLSDVPIPLYKFPAFELIGYPVAEGTAVWRNYQLLQGRCVYKTGDEEYYQADGQNRIIGKFIHTDTFNSTWNANTFMRDDSDGWSLYGPVSPQLEPKPAPRERVITISKCQDCPDGTCKLRQLAGLIPDACPLSDHKQYVRKALLDAYHLEHQSRNYKTNKE